jgi:hypothetical protein
MTFQGDQKSIVVSESGSAEDGLVSVRATSTTALRGSSSTALGGLCSTARRGLCSRATAPLPEGCPRNFGSEMPNAMARDFFPVLAVSPFFRFIFRDLLFFCDKSALLYCAYPNRGKVVTCKVNRAAQKQFRDVWCLRPAMLFQQAVLVVPDVAKTAKSSVLLCRSSACGDA